MPPADGSSTRGGSTSFRGRVRSPHMAKLQAASVPIAAFEQTCKRVKRVNVQNVNFDFEEKLKT